MKLRAKLLSIVLLFVGLVLVNYLASSLPVRVDLTADSIFSLSGGTKAMLRKIEEPVVVDLYFSRDVGGLPISYKNYATRIQEMLRQYVRESHGKLTLNVVNVQPDTPAEEKATAAGLSATPLGNGENFFFGLVATQADQQKTIPTFLSDPRRPFSREPFLEYDLSKVIYAVQQINKPKLGLLTSLPLQGTSPQEMQMMMMMRRQPQPSHLVIGELEQSFNIVKIEDAATELPAGLEALAVIHPQNVSPKLQFAIDQFLLAGKPVFLAVDPSSAFFKRQSNPQQQMMGQPAQNVTSDLPLLLNAYGIAFDSQKVVGDLDNPLPVGGQNGAELRMPTYLSLKKANFSQKSPTTAQLNTAWFIESGSISQKAGSTLTFTPLVETSSNAGDIASMMLQFAQPEDLAKQITASGKKTIAALVSGKFKTAFPDGAPKDEPKPDDKKDAKAPEPAKAADSLKESRTTSTLFVVADTDWILDDFSVQKQNFFGQTIVNPYNDNLSFVSNTIEFLGGSQDLISIRGKGSSVRPFTVVLTMQNEAQKKYQQQLTRLDADLADVQKKLSEMMGKKTEGNRLIATPEVAKAIADFQKKQTSLNIERRKISRALREDIDFLEKKLLVLNLLAAPLLVGAFGIWFYRSRKK